MPLGRESKRHKFVLLTHHPLRFLPACSISVCVCVCVYEWIHSMGYHTKTLGDRASVYLISSLLEVAPHAVRSFWEGRYYYSLLYWARIVDQGQRRGQIDCLNYIRKEFCLICAYMRWGARREGTHYQPLISMFRFPSTICAPLNRFAESATT